MAKIVLPLRSEPPSEPPYGGLGEEGWARGVTFYEFVERAGEHRQRLESAFRSCSVPLDIAEAFTAYRRQVRVLALANAEDLPSCAIVGCAERLFTLSSSIWMRVFDPDSCADLMQRYAPDQQPVPIFVFFGEDQREFARWRPMADPPVGAPHKSPFTDPEATSWILESLYRLFESRAAPGP